MTTPKAQNMDSCLQIMLLSGLLIASLQTTDGLRLTNQILRPIDQLQKHYNTLGAEWVGRPVFTPHLDHLNSWGSCTCQSMMLEGMLNMYEEIFTDMLNKSEKKEMKNSIKEVMTEVKMLRQRYSREQRLWRDLQDVHLIKVKNGTIQEAALNEFLMVFDKAYREKHHDRRH